MIGDVAAYGGGPALANHYNGPMAALKEKIVIFYFIKHIF